MGKPKAPPPPPKKNRVSGLELQDLHVKSHLQQTWFGAYISTPSMSRVSRSPSIQDPQLIFDPREVQVLDHRMGIFNPQPFPLVHVAMFHQPHVG